MLKEREKEKRKMGNTESIHKGKIIEIRVVPEDQKLVYRCDIKMMISILSGAGD